MELCVFNPSLGGEETADQKLLFYHPARTPIDAQLKVVGLSEALSAFCRTFQPASDPEVMHTQKRRHVLLQPEPGFWLVLIARNPTAPNANGDAAAAAVTHDNFQDAAEEELQDAVLQSLLRRIYTTLRTFCGALAPTLAAHGAEALRTLLTDHLAPRLRLAGLRGEDDTSRHDLVDALDGMRFLPVDRRLYLRAQYVVNLVQTAHPAVRHALLLHNEQLVWSSLSREATRELQRYLVHDLLAAPPPPPTAAERRAGSRRAEEFNAAAAAPLSASDGGLAISLALAHLRLRSAQAAPPLGGAFVVGAGDPMQEGRASVAVPRVFIEEQPGDGGDGDDGGGAGAPPAAAASAAPWRCSVYRLVVYQLQHTAVALLVDDSAADAWGAPSWYEGVAATLAAELPALSAQLADQHSRHQAHEDPFRYVYFNRLNLAVKTSVRGGGSGGGGGGGGGGGAGGARAGRVGRLGLSSALSALLNRTHADLAEGEVREVALKSSADGWLVGQVSGSRELYMLFDAKYTNLSEVHQEMLALKAQNFSNIFMD